MEVRVLKIKQEAALVEWRDGDNNLRRATIPTTELDGTTVSKRVLSMGVEYGTPWASLIKDIHVSATDIETNLRNRGIFTAHDLLANQAVARDVISNLIGNQLAALLRAANSIVKGGK
jgi:hypothetical protein